MSKNHPTNPINPRGANRPVTVFDLTVWAYRKQGVQYEPRRQLEVATEYGLGTGRRNPFVEDLLASVQPTLSGQISARTGRGCISGEAAVADVRAHIIHAHVRKLSSAAQVQIIKAGEAGKPPKWNPVVPAYRVIPSRRGGGTIRMMNNKHRRPIACFIEFQGTPPAIAEAMIDEARRAYRTWRDGLAKLEPGLSADPRLAEFNVRGAGAPKEPWVRMAQ